MGQKTHPLKFRLNTTQDHQSNWYAGFNSYPVRLEEDSLIRTFLFQQFKFDSVSQIKIWRHCPKVKGFAIALIIREATSSISS